MRSFEDLQTEIQLLDHGYVRLIETWGSDERIIEAARMSTAKGFLGWEPEVNYVCPECGYTMVNHQPVDLAISCPTNAAHGRLPYKLVHHGDEKLLRYLYEHKHMTPFEMAGMVIEVQAPIFVFREWHRHRTQSYNELSSRYTELPNLFYLPSKDRLRAAKQSTANKQSSEDGNDVLTVDFAERTLLRSYHMMRDEYEAMLAKGISREIARLVIPVAQYSRMRASSNLRNWLAFLTLRMDTAAQWEIRQYAVAVASLIQQSFPHTYELFAKHR